MPVASAVIGPPRSALVRVAVGVMSPRELVRTEYDSTFPAPMGPVFLLLDVNDVVSTVKLPGVRVFSHNVVDELVGAYMRFRRFHAGIDNSYLQHLEVAGGSSSGSAQAAPGGLSPHAHSH